MLKKILIIEDDKFLRKIIAKKLTQEEYEIFEAVDGEEGINLAKEKNPDLILLDLVLPSMDGFTVLYNLKKDKKSSKIPVIILSNLGQTEEINKGLKLGAVDYLIKAHLTPGEIVERIEGSVRKQIF